MGAGQASDDDSESDDNGAGNFAPPPLGHQQHIPGAGAVLPPNAQTNKQQQHVSFNHFH